MRTEPKKTETIEIRLAHEAKAAFMERCRRDRRSASEVVRGFIEQHGMPPAPQPRRAVPQWRVMVAALLGLGLGLGAAAPSLARGVDRTRAAFDRLDRNGDGVVSYAEFRMR